MLIQMEGMLIMLCDYTCAGKLVDLQYSDWFICYDISVISFVFFSLTERIMNYKYITYAQANLTLQIDQKSIQTCLI